MHPTRWAITLDLPINLQALNEGGNQELPAIVEPDISEIEPKFGALPPLNFS
jgi:hypothetical protein